MKANSLDFIINPARELANRRTARVACGIFLVLVVLLMFLPFFTYPDPPPGQEGILVSFGQPEVGMNSEPAASAAEEIEEEPVEEPVEEVEPVEEPEVEPEVKPETKPEPAPSKEVIENKNSQEAALKKKKAEEAKRQQLLEEQRKKKAQEEARKKAEAEAARKKAEYEKKKSQIGDLFKNDGSGQGNNNKPGNQGDPNGGDSDILDGISTGSGRVGGGLGNRGGAGPAVSDNSQETGRVVVKVCVNSNGKVVSANFTQLGSTTNSSRLISKAEANAKRWSFKSGAVDKQCGTITYDFKVK